MHGREPLHRRVQRREPALDLVEAVVRVQLAAQLIADVMHAPRGTMRQPEAASACTAERAAGMVVITRWRREIARPGAGAREHRELVIVEDLGRHPRTAGAAGVMTDREGLPGRARRARADLAEPSRHRELVRVDVGRERTLFGVGFTAALRAQALVERDDLVCARARLAQLDQQPLDGEEHPRTLAGAVREAVGFAM